MATSTLACGLMVAAVVATSSAEDFPLTFRTIPAQDIMTFPGGYGPLVQLRLTKPARLKREPKPVSQYPLYGDGRQSAGGTALLVRLDESKGGGKGYDEIIVDLNGNGDLTDETPAPAVALPVQATSKSLALRQKQKLFGPILAPADQSLSGGRPAYFAQGYVNSPSALIRGRQNVQNLYVGYVRLKAAWYGEATVEVNGTTRKVGVLDANCNLQLADLPKPETYDSGTGKNWYFQGGDAFLVDANGSGAFEGDDFESESCAWGPLLYFGAVPYKVTLTARAAALRIERWTEPLAAVALEPHGHQVQSVVLAMAAADHKWELIRPNVAAGKLQVPPGAYRLYSCQLLGTGPPTDQVRISGYQRVPKTPQAFAAGKANSLRCGAPLEIVVTASKRRAQAYDRLGDGETLPSADSQYVLAINGVVKGGDGEVYSTFAKGEQLKDDPPKPRFTVLDDAGKRLASGNLEFG